MVVNYDPTALKPKRGRIPHRLVCFPSTQQQSPQHRGCYLNPQAVQQRKIKDFFKSFYFIVLLPEVLSSTFTFARPAFEGDEGRLLSLYD